MNTPTPMKRLKSYFDFIESSLQLEHTILNRRSAKVKRLPDNRMISKKAIDFDTVFLFKKKSQSKNINQELVNDVVFGMSFNYKDQEEIYFSLSEYNTEKRPIYTEALSIGEAKERLKALKKNIIKLTHNNIHYSQNDIYEILIQSFFNPNNDPNFDFKSYVDRKIDDFFSKIEETSQLVSEQKKLEQDSKNTPEIQKGYSEQLGELYKESKFLAKFAGIKDETFIKLWNQSLKEGRELQQEETNPESEKRRNRRTF